MAKRPIKPGERVKLYTGTGREVAVTAGMPCSDTAPGHWYCASHPQASVPNNLSMSSHVGDPGNHVEVWVCHEHGPEAPYVIVGAEGSIR